MTCEIYACKFSKRKLGLRNKKNVTFVENLFENVARFKYRCIFALAFKATTFFNYRAISSAGSEHLVYTERVGSSNLSSPTKEAVSQGQPLCFLCQWNNAVRVTNDDLRTKIPLRPLAFGVSRTGRYTVFKRAFGLNRTFYFSNDSIPLWNLD